MKNRIFGLEIEYGCMPPDDDPLLLVDNLPGLVVDSRNVWSSVESQQRLANEAATLVRDYKSGAPHNSSLPA